MKKLTVIVVILVIIPGLSLAGALENAKEALEAEKAEKYEEAIVKQLKKIEMAKEKLRIEQEKLDAIVDKGADRWWIDKQGSSTNSSISVTDATLYYDTGTNASAVHFR